MNDAPIRTRPRQACLLCGTPGERLCSGLDDAVYGVPGKWSLRKCPAPDCGLVWMDPMPLAAELPRLYRNYFTHSPPPRKGAAALRGLLKGEILAARYRRDHVTDSPAWRIAGRLLAWIPFLVAHARSDVLWLEDLPPGRLLEVGGGAGTLATRMQRMGWQVVVLEPDPRAARHGRESLGLEVIEGTLDSAALPRDHFDAITMKHVLEHVPDPIAALRACRKALRPGGTLSVVTPNTDSLGFRHFGRSWRGLEPPRHLFLHNLATLARCAGEAGFSVERLTTSYSSARMFWNDSVRIRRYYREGALPSSPGRLSRIAAWLFWVLEQAAAKPMGRAEEAVLLARKPA